MPTTLVSRLLSRWPFIVILLLLACLAWLTPAYRKSVKDNETYTNQISDLQQRLVTASKTKTFERTYFPTGKLASETTSETDTDTIEITRSDSDATSLTRTHEEVTTKRGLLSVLVYADLNQDISGGFSYQIFSPISIGALYSGGKVYAGLGLSF